MKYSMVGIIRHASTDSSKPHLVMWVMELAEDCRMRWVPETGEHHGVEGILMQEGVVELPHDAVVVYGVAQLLCQMKTETNS